MAKSRTTPKAPAKKKPAAKRPARKPAAPTVTESADGGDEAVPASGGDIREPGTTLGVKSTNPDGITDPGTTLDSN